MMDLRKLCDKTGSIYIIILRYNYCSYLSPLCFYVLQHILKISELWKTLHKVVKKVVGLFGGYVVKQ